VENWLVNLLERTVPERVRTEFLVHSGEPGELDERVRRAGGRIHVAPSPRRPVAYARFLERFFAGRALDVLHVHMVDRDGALHRAAAKAGIPRRITHVHNLSALQAVPAGPRRLWSWANRRLRRRYVTDWFACSQQAADLKRELLGPCGPAGEVIFCGVNPVEFERPVDAVSVRSELGLGAEDFVVGHVGRFRPEKNHAFLLEVFAELRRLRGDARLLLVGEGEGMQHIRREAARRGLGSAVVFAGSRKDVPRLLVGAMDVFCFPSLREGLGLAAVEAQAAGLGCVIPDTLPAELDLVGGLTTRLSLADSSRRWADALLSAAAASDEIPGGAALDVIRQSRFNIEYGARYLTDLYGRMAA
jgi:glycosyltransferase involved in cell wall biosynthesis